MCMGHGGGAPIVRGSVEVGSALRSSRERRAERPDNDLDLFVDYDLAARIPNAAQIIGPRIGYKCSTT
jgi:hypothetical protein